MVKTVEEIMLTLKMMDDRKEYLDAEKEKPVVKKPVVKKPVVEKPVVEKPIKKAEVIREACFEIGTFYYKHCYEGKDRVLCFNIKEKCKTVAHVWVMYEGYDGEYCKMNIKYSLKHKCEYFKRGSTTLLCKDFKKEEE